MFSTRITILECGASQTVLGVFRRRGRALCLEECAIKTLPAPVGREENWLENTRIALMALRAGVKSPGPVGLILPAHLVLAKFLKIPRFEPARHERIIRFEAEQNIPYALADVVWDHVVVGERDIGLEVLLAAAKLDIIMPLCAAVQAAGFEPRFVLPAPLALLAAFRLVNPVQTGTSLVLNLGARFTTLLLAGPQRFALRTLPLGGNNLTPQAGKNPNRAFEEDKGVKVSDYSVPLTTGTMEALATRLAQEITRSVLHFRRQSDMEQPARVHLTGGDARLAGLEETLSAKLKLPVNRLDALGAIEIARGAARGVATEHALTFTDLAGAAATQLREGQPQVNLLPPEMRSQENLRRRQPWLIAAAALAVAALLPPVRHYRNLTAEAERKTAAIEHELAPLRARDTRHRANLAQLDELKVQAAQFQGVYDRRTGWLNLCADLQDRLVRVEDVWLEKLQVTPAAGGVPMQLVISGRMLDRTNPLSKVSEETTNRVKALLRDIGNSPYVTVTESGQRFDNSQPGILKFDFVLTANPARPL